MKNVIYGAAALAILIFPISSASGQVSTLDGQSHIRPAKPSSADYIVIVMPEGSCGGLQPYVGSPYRVSMTANNITVTQGRRDVSQTIPSDCQLQPSDPRREVVGIGQLPPGNYTFSVLASPVGTSPATTLVANAPFAVTDARAAKAAPYVRLNYTGGWYDPNDFGWGLFVSQDKDDNLVASWFTYAANGKSEWYSFQPMAPRWATGFRTITDNFYLINREPGISSPPATRASIEPAGTASLDFTPLQRDPGFNPFNSAVFTYTFRGGQAQVRTLQRFLQ